MSRKTKKNTGEVVERRDKTQPSWVSELPSFAVRLLGARRLRRMPVEVGVRCGWD
ncbi:MAG TPA: hypothetical protein VK968_14905 [Roseimicrobium sp.]|nr:hypothetical protein [Roseimicrobium sp.]